MAKCPTCQHKITAENRQTGKCPECGAPLAPLSETVQPPLNPQPKQAGGGGTAIPQPAEVGTDDKPFDAYHTVKPLAELDRTIVEQTLAGEFAATQAGHASFNATRTTPMEKGTTPIDRSTPHENSGAPVKGAAATNAERRKDSKGPETFLVIQSRDVQRGAAEVELRSDYEVSNLIGEGGMGVVYQARQASLDRDVALKMVKPRELDEAAKARYTGHEMQKVEQALQKRDREWFLSEAVVTANLEHPYIVPIYDVIKDRQDALFYAMKWVRGTPWNKSIRDKSINENLDILLKVGDAVAFAHDKGVIHRDLKPENVMVGAHGEVYVMDWGAALVTPDFERSTNLSQSSSGFGSPLYAAPELFLGTVDQIGVRSDVYLLGAILFEIVSGNPPHPYPSSRTEVLNILRRNEIRPTDYKGELLDIALKAMATDPANRYPSAQAFQTAIREYQSHSNSLTLSKRARSTLVKAEQTGDYQDYSRAVFAFDEAYELWHGNELAREGAGAAKLAFAIVALKKGDFDLGLSTADPSDPAHGDVIVKLKEAQTERDTRKQRLRTMRKVASGMAAVIIVGGTVLSSFIYRAKVDADEQRDVAKNETIKAEKARDGERAQREIAVNALKEEEIATAKAKEAASQEELAKLDAVKAKDVAVMARQEEELAKLDAVKAKDVAVMAREEERKAKDLAINAQKKALAAKAAQEYEAYVAEIGLADSKMRTAAFADVRRVLDGILENEKGREPGADDERLLRGWEFDRLKYLADQSRVLWEGNKNAAAGDAVARDLRIEALALTPDGRRFVAGRKDGTAVIGSTDPVEGVDGKGADRKGAQAGRDVMILDYGKPIYAVAVSPDSKLIATAGEPAADGSVQLWTDDGQKIGKAFAGGGKAVYSVQFADRQGKTWLLTAGADKTAQVWDLSNDSALPREIGKRPLAGHYGPVRQAVFSRDASQIVTVGDDFRAVVWDLVERSGQPQFESNRVAFQLHDSAILAVSIYSPAGKPEETKVVSADEDGRLLVWSPARLPRTKGSDDLANLANKKDSKSEKGESAVLHYDLAGHDKAVRAVAFSHDGKYVLSGGEDNTLKLQRLGDRSKQSGSDDVQTFRGHGGPIHGCVLGAFSQNQQAPDKERDPINNWFVVSAGHDGTVMRWNVSAYKEERVFHDPVLTGTTGPGRDVLSAAFSPDGKTVITGGRDHKAYQWDVRSGEKLEFNFAPSARIIDEGHELPIWTAAFAPDGAWLVTAGMDDKSILWNTSTGAQWGRLDKTGVPVVVAVSPDGQWIATSTSTTSRGVNPLRGPKVLFWNVHSLKTVDAVAKRSEVLPIEQQGQLTALAFAPAPALRLYAGFECKDPENQTGGGLVWELQQHEGHPKWEVVRQLPAKTQINAAVFLPGGTHVLTARDDGKVADDDLGREPGSLPTGPLRLDSSRTAFSLATSVRALALHPDGKSVLTLSLADQKGESPYMIRRWDLDSSRERHEKEIKIDAPNVFSLALAPEGDEALVVAAAPKGHPGTVVRRFDLETCRELTSKNRRPYLESRKDIRQYWGAIYAPSAAGGKADRRILALHGTRAELLDGTGKLVTRSNPHGQVRSVSYSSDGKFVLTAGSDGTIKVWDATTRQARCQIVNPHGELPSSIQSASFSPTQGSYQILSAGRDKFARLWNWDAKLQSPELARSLKHDSDVRSAAFSHDAAQIVCGCEDGTAWIWNAKDDQQGPRKTIKWDATKPLAGGHQGAVLSAVFSNGNHDWIVTAGEDNLAYVWDSQSLKVHAVLKGHASAVRCAAFSPDNHRVVTGSADTFAKVWDPRLPSDKQANAGREEPAFNARELLTLSRHERPVTSVAFSPRDGAIVLTASSDGDTVLWLSKPQEPGKPEEPGKK